MKCDYFKPTIPSNNPPFAPGTMNPLFTTFVHFNFIAQLKWV